MTSMMPTAWLIKMSTLGFRYRFNLLAMSTFSISVIKMVANAPAKKASVSLGLPPDLELTVTITDIQKSQTKGLAKLRKNPLKI